MTAEFFRDLVARCDAVQRAEHLTDTQMAERGGMRREQYIRARGKAHGKGDVETQTAAAFARIAGAVITVTPAAPSIGLDAPIAHLGLTRKAALALFNVGGIETVRSLTWLTRADLLKIRGFGSGCLREVEQALAAHGLRLAGGAS